MSSGSCRKLTRKNCSHRSQSVRHHQAIYFKENPEIEIIDSGSLYLQTFPFDSNLDGLPANAHSRHLLLKSARRLVAQALPPLPATYCPPDPRKFRCAPRPRPGLKKFPPRAPCTPATLPPLEPGPHQSPGPGPLLPALCGCMPRPSAIMAPCVAWPSCRWPPTVTGVPGPGLVQSRRIAGQRLAIRRRMPLRGWRCCRVRSRSAGSVSEIGMAAGMGRSNAAACRERHRDRMRSCTF